MAIPLFTRLPRPFGVATAVATSPQPPGLPGRRYQSGVYLVVRETKPRRLVRIRRPAAAEPRVVAIPYSDTWKSPTWVLAYLVLTAFALWVVLRP